jgi:hypothetical protein
MYLAQHMRIKIKNTTQVNINKTIKDWGGRVSALLGLHTM